MPTRNVCLTEHENEFIAQQISAGRHRDASEFLPAGLHLLEQQTREERERLALLQALASEGFEQLDRGQGIDINGPRQPASHIRRLGRRAATSVKRRARSG